MEIQVGMRVKAVGEIAEIFGEFARFMNKGYSGEGVVKAVDVKSFDAPEFDGVEFVLENCVVFYDESAGRHYVLTKEDLEVIQ